MPQTHPRNHRQDSPEVRMRDPKCDGVSNHRVNYLVRGMVTSQTTGNGADSTTNTGPRSKSLICKEKIISTFFAFPYKSMTYKTTFLTSASKCYKLHMMMRKRENMLIDFVGAQDGGLIFFGGVANPVGFGSTVEECALIIAKNGLASQVSGSSSMDFASEEGFENDDDAMVMFRNAIKLSGI